MTDDLIPFDFDGKSVRVFMRDGDPWFVAADACRVLEIGNPSQALTRLDEDERGLISNETPSGMRRLAVVSESGLYDLVLGSRKPEARQFKRWVKKDVLPAIRRTGSFGTARSSLPDLRDRAQVAALLAHTLAIVEEERSLRLAAETKVAADAPKVEFVDRYVAARGNLGLRVASKVLRQKQNTFVDWLIEQGFCYRTPESKSRRTGRVRPGIVLPYAGYEKYFEVRTILQELDDGDRARQQTMITPLGITWLAKRLGVEPDLEVV